MNTLIQILSIIGGLLVSVFSIFFCREKVKNLKAENKGLQNTLQSEKTARANKENELKEIQKAKDEIKSKTGEEVVKDWNEGK